MRLETFIQVQLVRSMGNDYRAQFKKKTVKQLFRLSNENRLPL